MDNRGKLYVGFDASGLFKIGITRDPDKRLKQFKTGNICFMYLFVFTVESPAVEEITLHTKFEDARVEGEWFQLDHHDIKWIYDRYTPTEHRRHDIKSFEIVWNEIANKKKAGNSNFRKFMSDYEAVNNEQR